MNLVNSEHYVLVLTMYKWITSVSYKLSGGHEVMKEYLFVMTEAWGHGVLPRPGPQVHLHHLYLPKLLKMQDLSDRHDLLVAKPCDYHVPDNPPLSQHLLLLLVQGQQQQADGGQDADQWLVQVGITIFQFWILL